MSDPTAMEADKTKEEMTMATIIKQTKEEINWAECGRRRFGYTYEVTGRATRGKKEDKQT